MAGLDGERRRDRRVAVLGGTNAIRLGANRVSSGGALADFMSGRHYGGLYLGREYVGTERSDVESFLAGKSGVTL